MMAWYLPRETTLRRSGEQKSGAHGLYRQEGDGAKPSQERLKTTMKRTAKYTTLGLLAAFGTTALAPAAVLADNDSARQSNKNLMRNLAIGGAAIAGLGLLNHNNGLALLGAAGAALAGSQYEKARHNQSVDQSRDEYYHRRNDGDYQYDGGNGRYGDNNGYRYNGNGYQPYGNAYGWRQHRDGDR